MASLSLMCQIVSLLLLLALVEARNVLTQHYDNARTGANTQETILNPSNVKPGSFGLLWKASLDTAVAGQVLIVENVNINNTGTLYETVFAWTTTNSDGSLSSAFAVDAKTGTILWHTPLNISAKFTTATGVIDDQAGIWYFVTRDVKLLPGYSNYEYPHWLHALDIKTGKELPGAPLRITGQVKSTNPNPSPSNVDAYNATTGMIDFTYCNSNVRPGLLLVNGLIIIGFAYNTDQSPYHGWLFSYSYSTSTGFEQKSVWCASAASKEGGIWQSGKGIASDGSYIYLTTGNGNYNASRDEYGMSVLKMTFDFKTVDYFTPYDWQSQSGADLDMGNCGPVLLYNPDGKTWANRAFVGPSKYGRSFILDLNKMGGFNPTTDSALQSFETGTHSEVGANGVAWSDGKYTYIYTYQPNQQLNQFVFDGNQILDTTNWAQVQPIYKGSPYTAANGGLSTSGNGVSGGILWMLGSSGQVWAINASNILQTPYWTNENSTDSIPSGGHFQFPVVANGRMYAYDGAYMRIYAYGLLNLAYCSPDAKVPHNGNGGTCTTTMVENQSCQMSCNKGFQLKSGNLERTCQKDGTFSFVETVCSNVDILTDGATESGGLTRASIYGYPLLFGFFILFLR